MSSHPHATAVLTPRKDASSTRPHSTQETARRITDQGGKKQNLCRRQNWVLVLVIGDTATSSSHSAMEDHRVTCITLRGECLKVIALCHATGWTSSYGTVRKHGGVTVSCTLLTEQLPLGSKKATRKYFSVQWFLISENDHWLFFKIPALLPACPCDKSSINIEMSMEQRQWQ